MSTGSPGSGDARVLRLSSLYRKATNEELLCEPLHVINGTPIRLFLLGDSAYLLPWLVGPYAQSPNLSHEQARFNRAVNKSRVVVERAFGSLKCRWRCLLKVLEESTEKVPRTVLACCILHNICTLRGDDLAEEYDAVAPDDNNGDGHNQPALGQGSRVRQALTAYLAEGN